MLELSEFRGPSQFGPAYRVMLDRDAHAPGSVDRVLVGRMVRLCDATAAYLYEAHTPTHVDYRWGTRPELERPVEHATADATTDEDRVAAIARFCTDLGTDVDDGLDAMRIGGTEEETTARGSDWCTDVARVGCILCQLAGVPSRIVFLANTGRAYSGHVIIEAFRSHAWGAVDVTTDVRYRHPDGVPATTWALMHNAALITAHRRGAETIYTEPDQFRAAAIANYFVADHHRYDYAVTGMNDYTRSILEMSARGWPGGLRWLHGEDET